jgi:hypothetical protein
VAGEEQAVAGGVRGAVRVGHGLEDQRQLLALLRRRRVEVAAHDEEVRAGPERGIRRPDVRERGHALDAREAADADDERQVAALGGEAAQQVVELDEGAGR